MSGRCICGHADNLHYAPSGRCMKVVTRHHSGNVDCTCRQFRPETPGPITTDKAQLETAPSGLASEDDAA